MALNVEETEALRNKVTNLHHCQVCMKYVELPGGAVVQRKFQSETEAFSWLQEQVERHMVLLLQLEYAAV